MSKDKGIMTDNLLADIMQAQQPVQAAADPVPAKRSKAQKTASVYMTNEQHTAIERIAQELQTTKHAVMQLAIIISLMIGPNLRSSV